MKLNRSHVQRALAGRTNFTKKQLQILGYYEPKIGLRSEIIGMDYPQESIDELIRLRYVSTGKPKKKPKGKLKGAKKEYKKKQRPPRKPKTNNDGLYRKPEWIKLRDKIYERDGHHCINCGKGPGDGHKIAVHHLVYERDKEVWEVPDWYLVTLCRDCHIAEHSKRLAPPPKHFKK